METIVKILLNSVAVLFASYILPGVKVENFWYAIVAAIALGIVNFLIKPVLIFLTLPVTIVTLGLFIFVINALLVLLVSHFVPGFRVDGFWWALLFSLVFSILKTILDSIFVIK